ncbi:MAG: RNA polymerase sigma factor [Candidatus Aminicenantales bacterium]
MKPLIADVPEEELVERAQQGDQDAYAELVRRNQEAIYRIIYRFTKNHNDTDDLAQETFLRAFRGLGQFKRKANFSTWVFRIAINLSLNFLKKRKKEKGMKTLEETMTSQAEGAHCPDSTADFNELRRRLNEAIDGLPLPYRSTFIMVVLEGLNHRRVARILGCSENTISWRVHKARKMIQAKLRPYLGEAGRGL